MDVLQEMISIPKSKLQLEDKVDHMNKESDQPLFLQILVGLTVIHVTLVILKLFHRFLLKDFMTTFLLQLFSDCRSQRQ